VVASEGLAILAARIAALEQLPLLHAGATAMWIAVDVDRRRCGSPSMWIAGATAMWIAGGIAYLIIRPMPPIARPSPALAWPTSRPTGGS
jgi:hypothetical protein